MLSPNGDTLAIASNKTAILFDVERGKLLRRIEDFKGPVTALTFSPDGKRLATASASEVVRDKDDSADVVVVRGDVRLWDVANGTQLARVVAHRGAVQSITFSSDGKRLATGGADARAFVWDVERLISGR